MFTIIVNIVKMRRNVKKAGGRGDGEMGRWGDGEMGRWGDGEMGTEVKQAIAMLKQAFWYEK